MTSSQPHSPCVTPLGQARTLVIGCGHMGAAILNGCAAVGGRPECLFGLDPDVSGARKRINYPNQVTLLPSFKALPRDFSPDVVVVAVKPL